MKIFIEGVLCSIYIASNHKLRKLLSGLDNDFGRALSPIPTNENGGWLSQLFCGILIQQEELSFHNIKVNETFRLSLVEA
jgi:hypothetical protein